MPRPRGRPKKRLSRMDAAVDAMFMYGFDKELVRRHVNELLREYGAESPDEAWPFIEDCSYKELLESILREQERGNLENVATNENQIEDKCGGDEELAGPSNIASETEQESQGNAVLDTAEPIFPDSIHSTTPVINNDGIGNGRKDIHPNQMVENHGSEKNEESPRREDSPSISTEIPRPPTIRKCQHFYGWIDRYEEDDDDDDFITLRPSSMVLGPPPKAGTPRKHWNGETRKRRSRWDVRPDDL